jgi:micrococcal nuclease
MLNNIINWLSPNKHKVSVVDGDTIIIYGGIGNLLKKTIRLIGINAPETEASTKFDRIQEIGGEEAKRYLAKLLLNQYVKIDGDSKSSIDKFNRVLAYVYLQDGSKDGVDVAEILLSKGLVQLYKYQNKEFDKLNTYKNIEIQAKLEKKGIWED